jgi:predicted ATPase
MSLARLWQSHTGSEEARELLAPVYERFTERFDTSDLKAAKSLIDDLSQTARVSRAH